MQIPTITSLRKNIFEWVIIGLSAAVIFLFHEYSAINKTVQEILINQNGTQEKIIDNNTRVLESVNVFINNQNKTK